ncbi:MAG: type I-E CRISPR-associated protein Cas5/CasD [Desulfobacterales bacterium]|nr:type I-E CRISPR-associated protein Cas5/CasD [Desulfobacterales bacterium]
MIDYLVFQLYAPMAAWGDQAVGQERPSSDHPSRSALLGLVAASIGISREDEDQHCRLSDACHFGIKLFSGGLILRDYHTTQVPPESKNSCHLHTRRDELSETKLGTILSSREYRQDSFSVIALWLSEGQTPFGMEQLRDALRQPAYHLYLGRKSCPLAMMLNPVIIPSDTLKAALDSFPVATEAMGLATGPIRYFWEEAENIGMNAHFHVPRYDQPISRNRWQFASRIEYTHLGQEEPN